MNAFLTKSFTKLLPVLALIFVVFSCDKDQLVDTVEDQTIDLQAYVGQEINDPADFPAVRTLTEAEKSFIAEQTRADFGGDDANARFRGPANVRNLSLFINAAIITGLFDELNGEELTVFAPTNAAFQSLGIRGVFDLLRIPVADLRALLEYHILEGRVFAADITNGYVPTIAENGVAVRTTVQFRGIFVNESQVIAADIFNLAFFNSVIHVVDQVLVPPTQTIPEIVIDAANAPSPQFTALLAAVVEAGLVETLSGDGPFTVLAPTDAAFADLLAALGVSDVSEIDDATLTAVLLYHVIPGRIFSTDFVNANYTTVGGSTVFINPDNRTVSDNGTNVDANIIDGDIQATNGVIQVIDKVLLP